MAALASIVLELKNLEYKNHSYALLLLLPIFTQLFYLTCLQNKPREKIWCQENLLYCEFVLLREVSAESKVAPYEA